MGTRVTVYNYESVAYLCYKRRATLLLRVVNAYQHPRTHSPPPIIHTHTHIKTYSRCDDYSVVVQRCACNSPSRLKSREYNNNNCYNYYYNNDDDVVISVERASNPSSRCPTLWPKFDRLAHQSVRERQLIR